MASASSRPGTSPAGTDLPTNENAIEVDLVENMSNTVEQIRDGVKPNAASDEPVVSIEGGFTKNMSSTLEQILDVLKGSTIAEERGKDLNSKFWATYKKVSNEYDDDFLGRANDDMGIILTFAGLFSAVNSTFIVGMQPNPGDTTNALLVQLINITVYGPNSVSDIGSLSSSTRYSSSNVWMQTLAYASLAFSVLAAFGAVMGKQWLNSYKAARGRGTLEERGIQRQMKLNGLEYFHLQTVLQAFLVLLQISLLLFGLSLSANVWTQQITISSVIICTTAFGLLFYAGTISVSVWRPDSPFQTAGSNLARAICKKIFPDTFTSAPDIFGKSSAIRWILETSTNPEIVEVAVAMVPFVQWSPNLDVSAVYTRLRDNFRACSDREEPFMKYGKAMARLCTQSVTIDPKLLSKDLDTLHCWGGKNRFISDAFMDGHDAYLLLEGQDGASGPEARRNHHWAGVRTALRTMVTHGLYYQFSPPDDEKLIWEGDLRWRHSNGTVPGCEEFDWLIDYLTGLQIQAPGTATDDESEGDALLALSAMRGLGSSAKRPEYIRSLVRSMDSTKPPRVRHAALRAVFEAQQELASLTSDSMPQGVDSHLVDALSRALLTAVCPDYNKTIHDKTIYQLASMTSDSMLQDTVSHLVHELSLALRPDHDKIIHDKTIHELASMTSGSMPHSVNAHLVHQLSRALLTAERSDHDPDHDKATHDSGPDTSFHDDRDYCYIRLIYTLTKNDEWCQRLACDGHLERCIFLVHHTDQSRSLFLRSYLPAIFGRIDPEGKHLRFSPAQDVWRLLISNTWQYACYYMKDGDYIDGLPAVVTATRLNLPGSDNSVQRDWLIVLADKVDGALDNLQQRRAIFVDRGVPQDAVDAAISSVQGMYDDLCRMIEDRMRKITHRDHGQSLRP